MEESDKFKEKKTLEIPAYTGSLVFKVHGKYYEKMCRFEDFFFTLI